MSKIETARALSTVQTEGQRREVRSTTEAQALLIETLDRLATDQSRLTVEYRAAAVSLIETLTKAAEASEAMILGAHGEAQNVLMSATAAVSKADKAAAKTADLLKSAETAARDQHSEMKCLVERQTALSRRLMICAIIVAVSAAGTLLGAGLVIWRVMHPL